MKFSSRFTICGSVRACAFVLLAVIPLNAEDWTVNGKDYHNVKVGRVEADRVHITYDGGIGTMMIADLTPDLRKRFGYDPAAAKATTDERSQQEAQADAMLAAEAKQKAKDDSAHPIAVQIETQPKTATANAQQIADLQAQLTALESDIKQKQSFANQNHGKGAASREELSQRAALEGAIMKLGGTPHT